MRDFLATMTFFIVGTGTFRVMYGQWPPTSGNFGQWLLSDGKARWAILAGMLVGMVATSIMRGLTGTLHPADARLDEASHCLQLAMTHHQDRRIEEAIQMYQQAIRLYTECGRETDAAPAYASLGKLYFDTGALDLAEQQLMKARPRFAQQMGARDAAARTDAILQLIAERRQASNVDTRYSDALFHFTLTIPPGWVKQSLVGQFAQTGGRVAISHTSHAATLNVSVGPPDKPAWLAAEPRSRAATEYARNIPSRIGPATTVDPTPIGGEANVVIVEYATQALVSGQMRQRKNGLISVVHNGLEYTLQWSAEQEYEYQARAIIQSFTLNGTTRI
jgi:Tetratricopeptide repeat